MRIAHLMAGAAMAGALIAPGVAAAANAFTTGDVNMRAGPSTRFPRVTTLPEGVAVTVHGCIGGWSWCDTSWRGARGWVSGGYLEQIYRGRRVLVPEYGRSLGVPIISFHFGNYWDRWYADRPWYRDRPRWRRDWERDWSRRDRDRDWRDRDEDRDWSRRDRDGDRGFERRDEDYAIRRPDRFDRDEDREDSERRYRDRDGSDRVRVERPREEDEARDVELLQPERARRRSEDRGPRARNRRGRDCPPGLRMQDRCEVD